MESMVYRINKLGRIIIKYYFTIDFDSTRTALILIEILYALFRLSLTLDLNRLCSS